ncbi:MAG: putative ABC transporter permease [Bacilli bacterium]|nr:putative ABC transporter permease [Bacilli bacterium]
MDFMQDINTFFEYFLLFVYLFFIGSMVGWIIEVLFRRWYHKKWINPGFLVGPYLPIYGFGLSMLTFVHLVLQDHDINDIFEILIMGGIMTLLELVTGLIFLKQGIRLWDYRERKFNYKGVICPTFTIIWTAVGALYYFFLSEPVVDALRWFTKNISFSYVLGIFTGVIVIDFIYSTKFYKKIKKFAKKNNMEVMSEKFKEYLKELPENAKHSFMFPFRQTKNLLESLGDFLGLDNDDKKEEDKDKGKK